MTSVDYTTIKIDDEDMIYYAKPVNSPGGVPNSRLIDNRSRDRLFEQMFPRKGDTSLKFSLSGLSMTSTRPQDYKLYRHISDDSTSVASDVSTDLPSSFFGQSRTSRQQADSPSDVSLVPSTPSDHSGKGKRVIQSHPAAVTNRDLVEDTRPESSSSRYEPAPPPGRVERVKQDFEERMKVNILICPLATSETASKNASLIRSAWLGSIATAITQTVAQGDHAIIFSQLSGDQNDTILEIIADEGNHTVQIYNFDYPMFLTTAKGQYEVKGTATQTNAVCIDVFLKWNKYVLSPFIRSGTAGWTAVLDEVVKVATPTDANPKVSDHRAIIEDGSGRKSEFVMLHDAQHQHSTAHYLYLINTEKDDDIRFSSIVLTPEQYRINAPQMNNYFIGHAEEVSRARARTLFPDLRYVVDDDWSVLYVRAQPQADDIICLLNQVLSPSARLLETLNYVSPSFVERHISALPTKDLISLCRDFTKVVQRHSQPLLDRLDNF